MSILNITAEANCWQKQELYKGRGGISWRRLDAYAEGRIGRVRS